MALIIEDGSLVADASSYVSVADARAYASARGVELPADDSAVEVLLIKAMDFLEFQESSYQGERVEPTQALAWPREGVYLHGELFDSDLIPVALRFAQCQLVIDAQTVDLLPNGQGREVVREKVDVIETEYAPTGSGSILPQLNKASAILRPLFAGSSGSNFVDVIRV